MKNLIASTTLTPSQDTIMRRHELARKTVYVCTIVNTFKGTAEKLQYIDLLHIRDNYNRWMKTMRKDQRRELTRAELSAIDLFLRDWEHQVQTICN